MAITFSLVNTANSWVWGSLPDEDSGSDVTFTKCYEWAEVNSDIEDVWSEADLIPEFPTLAFPIASVIFIFGFTGYRQRRRRQ